MTVSTNRTRIAAFGAVLARLFGAASTGGLTVYVARAEGVEESGRFFVLVSILSALSLLTRLGSDAYLTSVSAGLDRSHRSRAVAHTVTTSLVVTLMVLTMVALLTVAQICAPSTTDALLAGHAPWQLGLATLGLNSIWLAGAASRASGHAAVSIFLETGFFSLCLFVFVMVQQLRGGPLDHTHLLLTLGLLAVPWSLWGAIRAARASVSLDLHLFVRAFRGILAYASTALTNGVVVLIPVQALGYFRLVDEAGVYNAALRISMLVGAFGVVIRSLAVRAYRSDDGKAAEPKISDLTQALRSTLGWVAISLLVATQATPLARVLGEDFSRVSSILAPMLVAQCVYIGGSLLEVRAVLGHRRRMLNQVAAVTVCTGLASSFAFVALWELPGAVLAFALTVLMSRAALVTLYVNWLRSTVRTSTNGGGYVTDSDSRPPELTRPEIR